MINVTGEITRYEGETEAISPYTRHTSSCMCVGCSRSPESLTSVNSSGFSQLPPSCNSNYLRYKSITSEKT
ncbi:hypothetical protein DVQ01_15555 [Yersinia enterocolitica]|nr:hypothetical protein [Yersinia enterocolitica]EKN5098487.1 hypothetical protein [Yersinia enterocolitica]EKN5127356.1 hypothetical protein [Yersinia enterocolitica]EKN5132486.1 hypothetical protein [Yersinia enterocolitica]EKN5152644.1 hypothetical protein [Yersinia enterocolitica]